MYDIRSNSESRKAEGGQSDVTESNNTSIKKAE